MESKNKFIIGCVAENSPKYLGQALRLLQSVRWFGGSISQSDFIVCVIDGIDEDFRSEFLRLGALVRIVSRFSHAHPPSNKLRFFELPELSSYDTVIYLDCDTIVTRDPAAFLDKNTFKAKIADGATVSYRIFEKLFSHYGLHIPVQEYKCSVTGVPTIWYCNAGVLIFPKSILKDFLPVWLRFTIDLNHHLELLEESSYFCEQAALSLAFGAHPVPFTELPIAMNFPLHRTAPKEYDAFVHCDPYIIHYHNCVTDDGFIEDSPFRLVHDRVDMFNSRLREYRGKEVIADHD